MQATEPDGEADPLSLKEDIDVEGFPSKLTLLLKLCVTLIVTINALFNHFNLYDYDPIAGTSVEQMNVFTLAINLYLKDIIEPDCYLQLALLIAAYFRQGTLFWYEKSDAELTRYIYYNCHKNNQQIQMILIQNKITLCTSFEDFTPETIKKLFPD